MHLAFDGPMRPDNLQPDLARPAPVPGPLSREDLIELGASFPTGRLVEWASGQLAATVGRESRLRTRGVDDAHLSGMKDLLGAVEKRTESEDAGDPDVPAIALAGRVRVEALGYLREAQRIAAAEFGPRPEVLAKFRRGVLIGFLIANLVRELEIILDLLREHAPDLSGAGGNAAFLGRGALLVEKLKEAKAGLDRACRELPTSQARRCHDKGLLYDLTRKLVRSGRLEFAPDREAAAFNFAGMRPPLDARGRG